jgi:hypothetical protein
MDSNLPQIVQAYYKRISANFKPEVYLDPFAWPISFVRCQLNWNLNWNLAKATEFV